MRKEENKNKWVKKIREMSDEEILEKKNKLLIQYSVISVIGFLSAIIAFILFLMFI